MSRIKGSEEIPLRDTCETCQGQKEIANGDLCPNCEGRGKVTKWVPISVFAEYVCRAVLDKLSAQGIQYPR